MDKTIEEQVQEEVKKALAEIVPKLKASLIPHTCYNCVSFVLRTEKPRNRVCRYPKPLDVKGNQCMSFELQPDPEKRINRLY